MTNQENLDMALDLLVARASLDDELRQELLANPQAHCLENGIQLPEGTQLIFKNEDSNLIIKEIPILETNTKKILRSEKAQNELVSNCFNSEEVFSNIEQATFLVVNQVNESQVEVEVETNTMAEAEVNTTAEIVVA